MAISQNGYEVLPQAYPGCSKWVIPTRTGDYRHVILRKGHVGFVLACFITWFHRRIEPVNYGQWDEWGWAYRPVRGQTSGFSNHASGTAVDINATKHPLGVRGTFSPTNALKVRRRLNGIIFAGVIRWGGDYQYRADEMHFEINKSVVDCRKAARRLRHTPVGRAVVKANASHYTPPKWWDRAG